MAARSYCADGGTDTLVGRSMPGRNNRETAFNHFDMFRLLRIRSFPRPPTVPNFKVGFERLREQDEIKTLNLGARGESGMITSSRVLLHFDCLSDWASHSYFMLLFAFPIISPGDGRPFCRIIDESRHGKPMQIFFCRHFFQPGFIVIFLNLCACGLLAPLTLQGAP